MERPQNPPRKNNRRRKGRKRNGRRRQTEDRYYGRFHCRLCNRHWESSRVYTVAGTRIVKYKQGCKTCNNDEAWYFPYALEILMCSICGESPCECRCEDCDGLIHARFWENPDSDYEYELDPNFEYCECIQDKDWHVGNKIDQKKPHLADLCGKCKSGRPCNRGGVVVVDFDNDGDD